MTIEGSVATAPSGSSGGISALLAVPGSGRYESLEPLVGALLGAGHNVLVVVEDALSPEDRRRLAELRERQPRLDHVRLRPRRGMWSVFGSAISRTLEHVRELEADPAGAAPESAPARVRAPRAARALLRVPPFRSASGRRALAGLLRRVEAGIPVRREVRSLVSDRQPDVVLVSPAGEAAWAQADYIHAADAARIPSLVLDAAHSNGAAVEGVARQEVSRPPEGRLARPLLWLLSPLIAMLLVALRPRASAREAVAGLRRLPRQAQKRSKARSRARAEESKAQVIAARQEKAAARKLKEEKAQAKAERPEKTKRPKKAKRGTKPAKHAGKRADEEPEA